MDQVLAIGLKNGESADQFGERFKELVNSLQAEDEIVLLADIVGGSPLTTALNVLGEAGRLDNMTVVGGMNLPMALTAVVMKDALEGDALTQTLLNEGASGLQKFDTSSSDGDDDEDDI